MHDAILFDLDGTLLDTLQDIANSANSALVELGQQPYPVDDYRVFVGEGMRALMARALGPTAPDADVDEALALMRSIYTRRKLETTSLYPGVRELLDALRQRRLPTAVLSNKPHDFTVEMVGALFGADDFRAVYGYRPPEPRKPAPASALRIASELGVVAERCIFVGDTRTDMETAVAAGMTAIGVSWGFRPVSELLEFGATVVLDTPIDLLNVLA